MVAPRKIYDFCERAESADTPPAEESPGGPGNEFFIDGWDAYGRWLDNVRDNMDVSDEAPG